MIRILGFKIRLRASLSGLLLIRMLLTLTGAPWSGAEPAVGPASSIPVSYVIVVTGGELLEGAFADGHTLFLVRSLRPLGCVCRGSIVVGDKKEDLLAALRYASSQASLVIVTGGLGPTQNDITRETISAFSGIPLREQPDVLAGLKHRFSQSGETLRSNVQRQALVPVEGGYLPNRSGTAVGLVFEAPSSLIVALPGPPRELQPMVSEQLVPLLRQRFGVQAEGKSFTLRFVGVGQSFIDQKIRESVPLPDDLILFSSFADRRVDFTFALANRTVDEETRLNRLKEEIKEHLGPWIYADDWSTLEETVAEHLEDHQIRLVLVEIGTAGRLVHQLSQIPAKEQWLAGAYVAADDAQMAQLLQLDPRDWDSGTAGEQLNQFGVAAARHAEGTAFVVVGSPRRDDAGASIPVVRGLADGVFESKSFGIGRSAEVAGADQATAILDWLRHWQFP